MAGSTCAPGCWYGKYLRQQCPYCNQPGQSARAPSSRDASSRYTSSGASQDRRGSTQASGGWLSSQRKSS